MPRLPKPIAFAWALPGRLAGSGLPGLLRPFDDDMAFLRDHGIRVIVTLTETALSPDAARYGVQCLHFPIDDMGIPTPRAAHAICERIAASVSRGEPVLVHCRAGLGRTGVILACSLVAMGDRPGDALAHIRRINKMYVQTESQQKFIAHYAAFASTAAVTPDDRTGRL